METAPFPRSQETLTHVDLLEVFADREITLFGITGTFTDLKDMCPVDLAHVSLDVKNEFVVKAANEAGLEVEAKYASVFRDYSEKLGLEAKFTIAEKPPEPDKPKESEKPEQACSHSKETNPKDSWQELQSPQSAPEDPLDLPSSKMVIEDASRHTAIEAEETTLLSSDIDEQIIAASEQSTPDHIAAVHEITDENQATILRSTGTESEPFTTILDLAIAPTKELRTVTADSAIIDFLAEIPREDTDFDSLYTMPELDLSAPDIWTAESSGQPTAEQDDSISYQWPTDQEYAVNIPGVLGLTDDISPLSDFELAPQPFDYLPVQTGEELSITDLPSGSEEIELALEKLSYLLDTQDDDSEPNTAHIIIERIINLPSSPETPESIIELEALFTQLFEEAEVAYSSELISSFMALTYVRDQEELAAAPVLEPGLIQEIQNELGTKEFLQQIQRKFVSIKNLNNKLNSIGRSILRLYNSAIQGT